MTWRVVLKNDKGLVYERRMDNTELPEGIVRYMGQHYVFSTVEGNTVTFVEAPVQELVP